MTPMQAVDLLGDFVREGWKKNRSLWHRSGTLVLASLLAVMIIYAYAMVGVGLLVAIPLYAIVTAVDGCVQYLSRIAAYLAHPHH